MQKGGEVESERRRSINLTLIVSSLLEVPLHSPPPLLPLAHTHTHTSPPLPLTIRGSSADEERKDMIRSVLSVCAG